MTTPAKNIDQTYRACNPEKPLKAEDKRYVDLSESRGLKQIALSVTRQIRRSEPSAQVKLLFTGHRGSGKTTELLRLKKELEKNSFFTIYMDVEELLDLGSLDYLDVLVAIARQVQAGLHEHGLPLSPRLLDNISVWFAEHIIEDTKSITSLGALKGEIRAGNEIPFFARLFASVTANIQAASSRRETIRRNLRREISVFIEQLNLLITHARKNVREGGFQDLVLIVDGIEKMHYVLHEDGQSSHSKLFVQHAEQLRAPHCHIIYTVPVSLAYHQNLGADFDNILVLPMVRIDESGIRQLLELLERRVDIKAVFADSSLPLLLVRTSGGVVRDLMRLIRMSTDTDESRITAAEVEYAVNTLKKEYDRLIRSDYLPVLRQIDQTKRIQGDDEVSGCLLHLRLALEYQNGDRWTDLHPIIRQIPWVWEALVVDGAI